MKIQTYTGILLLSILIQQPFNAFGQKLSISRLKYIQADSSRQKWGDFAAPDWLRYFGLDFGDVNRDGYKDIVSGRYFYLNPGGGMTDEWKRFDLGMNVDGYLFTDVDGDSYSDIIGEAFPDVYWIEAENRNGTAWKALKIGTVPATDHVNGQGGIVTKILPGKKPQIILATGDGIYAATIPEDPERPESWKFNQIIDNHFDEGMDAADFDGDGDLDLATGELLKGEEEAVLVNWYENPGKEGQKWKSHRIGHTLHWTDRFSAADLDGDKRPDIVVSEERYPGPDPDAHLFWFRNPGKKDDNSWTAHDLLTGYSLNNLDAADIDNDGDNDIVTNEHKGKLHKLFLLENDGRGNFMVHIADTGKECHLGCRLVDLDSDGDIDIVGHAWDNYKYLHIWRNDAIQHSSPRISLELKELTSVATLHPDICDIDRDGLNDIVCVKDYVDANGDDGTNTKSVGFFRGPDFEFHTVYRTNFRSCEMHTADVDRDGFPDIIGREDSDADDTNETGIVFWLRNPGVNSPGDLYWEKHEIGHSSYTKDIWHSDFNSDGRTDIAARASDGKLHVFIQMSPTEWSDIVTEVPLHDGMAIADIDNDGDPDIALNGFWIETPSDPLKETWIKHDFAPEWYSQKTGATGKWWDNNTKVTTFDMNGDGRTDILISQAESAGWPVCWYGNPGADGSTKWEQHIIGYMDYCHTLQVADVDGDGDPDLFCGELIPGDDRRKDACHPVVLFLNTGNSLKWERQEIDARGCYGGKAGDLDNDGDIDFVAPRNYERGPLQIWFNIQGAPEVQIEGGKISSTETGSKWCRSFMTSDAIYFRDSLMSIDGGKTLIPQTRLNLTQINGAPERAVLSAGNLFYALDGPVVYVTSGVYRGKAWRSVDNLGSLAEEEPLFYLPEGAAPLENINEWYGLFVYRTIIPMPDGTWLMTMYGNFRSDTLVPYDEDARKETLYMQRTIIVTSADKGSTWHYLSTVAAPVKGDPVGEGLVEPAITRLQDGRLLCVMRSGHHYPLYSSWSSDNGKSWTAPVYTGLDRGCDPCLITLHDGRVALSWGRRFPEGWSELSPQGDKGRFEYPGEGYTNLSVSSDGGLTWETRKIIKPAGSCYSNIFEPEPGTVFMQSDQWYCRIKLMPPGKR